MKTFNNLSKQVPSPLDLTLDRLNESDREIIIYGAGTYAYVVYKFLKAKEITVRFLTVDEEYKVGDEYLGLEVKSFEEILPKSKDYEIVIGVASYPSMVNRLLVQGIDKLHVVDVPDFLNIPNDFLDVHFLHENEKKLHQASACFEDELSKETFSTSLNAKLNQDVSLLEPLIVRDHLYFGQTEFPISDNETVLDVGAFNGDSIRDLVGLKEDRFDRIISLEPLPEIFEQLQITVEELGLESKCDLLMVGAWDEKTTLSFLNTEEDIDSKIIEGGEKIIGVDTIDSMLEANEKIPTLIKMDINGAESRAVKGAVRTIKNHKPKLAIKLHVKEDFYRLPLLLKEIAPDIKLYLRQRNNMSMMLMLYGFFD